MKKGGYVGSFDFEWATWRRLQFGRESEESFALKTGFTPAALRGKLVLDAGCGAGRYMDVAERWGAEVVGFDLSSSISQARKNLAGREKLHFVQADVTAPPFRDEIFDYIHSTGVLHHTPNPERAFRSLPKLLKKGGKIAVWVYARPHHPSLDAHYRKLTTRLPKRLLYWLCHIAIPLYYVKKIPLFGILHLMVPTSRHPDWRWRILDTYDWYSPKYQHKHTNEEIVGWFEDLGLVNIRVLEFPVSVTASRP